MHQPQLTQSPLLPHPPLPPSRRELSRSHRGGSPARAQSRPPSRDPPGLMPRAQLNGHSHRSRCAELSPHSHKTTSDGVIP